MLYLAEIQKQSKGFMGGFETKLKLLANQTNNRSWNVVPGSELIAIDDPGNLGDGALVMVNLGSNRQVQGTLEPASTRIISILQSFSRLLDKSKSQEEEIETWKESLTIQSEQLSAREIEMETRLEQLERMEEEFNQFDEQRAQISAAREEAQKLKNELEFQAQQIAQEKEKLQEEQQRLQQNLKEGKFLDESQAEEIQNLLDSLSAEINSTGSLSEYLPPTLSEVDRQQEILTKHWQNLQQNQQNIEFNRNSLLESQSAFNSTQEELTSLIASSGETEQQLATQEQLLEDKQKTLAILVQQQQSQAKVKESLDLAGISSSSVKLGQKIDIKALENMPLSELEEIVANEQKDLEKTIQFVQDQEEELGWQCRAVEEIEEKIKQANEFDRIALEQELADEREAKKMLDETLVGQRRSLKERHERFLQHSRILKRRQGIFDLEAQLQTIDLEPIKNAVALQQKQLSEQKESLELEIITIEQKIITLKADVEQKISQEKILSSNLQQQRDTIEKQNLTIAEIQAQLNFYQENLQPLQDSLNQIRENLEAISSSVSQNGATASNPNEVLTEIDRRIKELVSA